MDEARVLIQVSELTKVFENKKAGPVRAVSGLSFDCLSGEVYGLLGPNGAGKTTTLRILATLLSPTSGVARICGVETSQDPVQVRRSIGFLSGTTGLYPRLTPFETLEFVGRLFGLSGQALRSRMDLVMETLEIAPFAHVLCERLSSGMKQRVSIARATLHDPDVLIMDEPTTGLDVLGVSATMEFIRSFKDRQKCVLFSTHRMTEAEKVCDRLGIIHQGRMLAQGCLEELRRMTQKEELEDVFLDLLRRSQGCEQP